MSSPTPPPPGILRRASFSRAPPYLASPSPDPDTDLEGDRRAHGEYPPYPSIPAQPSSTTWTERPPRQHDAISSGPEPPHTPPPPKSPATLRLALSRGKGKPLENGQDDALSTPQGRPPRSVRSDATTVEEMNAHTRTNMDTPTDTHAEERRAKRRRLHTPDTPQVAEPELSWRREHQDVHRVRSHPNSTLSPRSSRSPTRQRSPRSPFLLLQPLPKHAAADGARAAVQSLSRSRSPAPQPTPRVPYSDMRGSDVDAQPAPAPPEAPGVRKSTSTNVRTTSPHRTRSHTRASAPHTMSSLEYRRELSIRTVEREARGRERGDDGTGSEYGRGRRVSKRRGRSARRGGREPGLGVTARNSDGARGRRSKGASPPADREADDVSAAAAGSFAYAMQTQAQQQTLQEPRSTHPSVTAYRPAEEEHSSINANANTAIHHANHAHVNPPAEPPYQSPEGTSPDYHLHTKPGTIFGVIKGLGAPSSQAQNNARQQGHGYMHGQVPGHVHGQMHGRGHGDGYAYTHVRGQAPTYTPFSPSGSGSGSHIPGTTETGLGSGPASAGEGSGQRLVEGGTGGTTGNRWDGPVDGLSGTKGRTDLSQHHPPPPHHSPSQQHLPSQQHPHPTPQVPQGGGNVRGGQRLSQVHTSPTHGSTSRASHSREPWLYVGEEAEYDEDDGEGGTNASVAGGEAEGVDDEGMGEERERPKKRRRTRVALSCAECKRRKIKCDRAQPCTPCSRRGDQSNCKWTVLETKDGGPTRVEFEALQARLAQVERMLYSLAPNATTNGPTYHPNEHGTPGPPPPPPPHPRHTHGNPYPDTHSPHGRRGSGSNGGGKDDSHTQSPTPSGAGPMSGKTPVPARETSVPPPEHDFEYGHHRHVGYGYADYRASYDDPPSERPRGAPPGSKRSSMQAEGLGERTREESGGCEQGPVDTGDAEHVQDDNEMVDFTTVPPGSTTLTWLPPRRDMTEPPMPVIKRPTLRLLPEALRQQTTSGRLAGTTFPLSDADWEQMTSVALAGANKRRTDAGAMHVDVQRELQALVGTLPTRDNCNRIWACYLQRLEWQHAVLHPGTFQQMYDTFWAFKTNAERAACTPIAWLALLLIVMSHGLATMRPTTAKMFGIVDDPAHWRMLCTQLWIASERALALDNFSHAATLEVVQTLVLLSYRALGLDPKGWTHQAPILAMAIRVAMCMGLNNVVADKPGEIAAPGLYKRELRRRIWYNIVYLDWRFSVPMGETYFINPYHFGTMYPANLEWGEMVDGTTFRPQSATAFTSLSMFLAKVHNAVRVRELCDALTIATRNAYQDIARLFYDHEVAVNETITLEPPCLISKDEVLENADKRVQWARIGHTLELDYRAIQIHRSFLVTDFREARARNVCVDTAEKMLECFAEAKRIDAPSAWWWYGYIACVVLMMEQYYSDMHQQADVTLRLNQKLDSIMAYVALQRDTDEVTVRAWDGILILETLIAELQKRRIAATTAATASRNPETRHRSLKRAYEAIEAAPSQTVTRVPSSSPIHAFRKWILNVMPFLKLPPVPGLPLANPRQRDMDPAFWDAILDIDTELHKPNRRGNFGKS